jgi:hypothetical protein
MRIHCPRTLTEFWQLDDRDSSVGEYFDALTVSDEEVRFTPGDYHARDTGGQD